MEIGNEIGQKIRSAIKAKLVDLGAYVDDELPDYIMVMVANKKTQLQMAEDLSLFLGANTSKFTTWLHGLLEKLQSITSDSAVQKSERQSQVVTDALSNKTSSSSSNTALHIAAHEKKTPAKESKESHRKDVTQKSSEKKSKERKTDSVTTDKKMKQDVVETVKNVAAIEVEPELRVHLEHDEFEEESENLSNAGIGSGAHAGGKRVSDSRTRTSSAVQRLSERVMMKRLHDDDDEEYVPQPYVPQILGLKGLSNKTHPKKLDRTNRSPPSRTTIHRRGTYGGSGGGTMGSLVGAVLSHAVEEEEYDPCRPAIGNVASIIKITDRRSSVPATMQANKSLLLRAMQQAEQSVANMRRKADTDKVQHEDESSSHRQRMSVHQRLGLSEGSSLIGRIKSRSRSPRSRSRSMSLEKKNIRIVATYGKPRTAVYCSSGARETQYADDVFIAARETDEIDGDRRNLVVRSHAADTDDEYHRKVKRQRISDPGPQTLNNPLTIDEDNAEQSQRQQIFHEVESQEVLEPEEGVVEEQGNLVGESPAESLNEGEGVVEGEGEGEDTQSDEEDLEQLRQILMQQRRQNRHKKKKKQKIETKFVVTLDSRCEIGCRDEYIDEGVEIVDLTQSADSLSPVLKSDPPSNVVRVKPHIVQPSISDADIQAFNRQAVMGVMPMMKSEGSVVQKISERCRFWPTCKNGETCAYLHPSKPCRTFPQCRFGDKCLYIHPMCKYNDRCGNTNCPYTHTVTAAAISGSNSITHIASQKVIKCKYYPNCTDANCPYQHVKACRYGMSCMNKAVCPFNHTQQTGACSMKWIAEQMQNTRNSKEIQTASTSSLNVSVPFSHEVKNV